MNQLYVEGPRLELTAAQLIAALDRGLADARHRRAIVTDDATGRRIADGMQAAGYSSGPLGVMVLDRKPGPVAGGSAAAREITEDEHRALEARIVAADPGIQQVDHPVILRGHAHMRATVPGTRSFAGLAGGEPVCQTTLYCRDGVGQPEDVETLPEHRGRGAAAAAVTLAAREALAAGCELVFLLCNMATGPYPLYGELGFRAVGRCWTFNRPAP